MANIISIVSFGGVIAAGAALGLSVPAPFQGGTPVATAHYGFCYTGGGTNCVVDGDTAWIAGEKVRIADIDAPEIHPSRCPREAMLGSRATERLAALMNGGAFELRQIDRDTDRYGRKLRILVRNGQSLGTQLVSEGLARPWDGGRHPWC